MGQSWVAIAVFYFSMSAAGQDTGKNAEASVLEHSAAGHADPAPSATTVPEEPVEVPVDHWRDPATIWKWHCQHWIRHARELRSLLAQRDERIKKLESTESNMINFEAVERGQEGMVLVPREPTRQLASTLCNCHPSNLKAHKWQFARKRWAGLIQDSLATSPQDERKE